MNLSLSFLILSATITLIHASFPKLSSIKNVVVHFEDKEFLIDSVLPNNIPGSSSDPDAISLTSAYGSDVPLPRPATFLRSVAWSVSCSFCFCPDPDIFVLFFSVAMVQRRRRSSSGWCGSISQRQKGERCTRLRLGIPSSDTVNLRELNPRGVEKFWLV